MAPPVAPFPLLARMAAASVALTAATSVEAPPGQPSDIRGWRKQSLKYLGFPERCGARRFPTARLTQNMVVDMTRYDGPLGYGGNNCGGTPGGFCYVCVHHVSQEETWARQVRHAAAVHGSDVRLATVGIDDSANIEEVVPRV